MSTVPRNSWAQRRPSDNLWQKNKTECPLEKRNYFLCCNSSLSQRSGLNSRVRRHAIPGAAKTGRSLKTLYLGDGLSAFAFLPPGVELLSRHRGFHGASSAPGFEVSAVRLPGVSDELHEPIGLVLPSGARDPGIWVADKNTPKR